MLLLCDVLGFSTAEVAAMLDTTEIAVKGVLQRARASLDRSRKSTGGSARGSHSAKDRELARRFAQAFTEDDIEGIVELLADDAWLAMPLAGGCRGQPAARLRLLSRRLPPGRPSTRRGILVLNVADGRVSAITRFLDPRLYRHFGLPDVLG